MSGDAGRPTPGPDAPALVAFVRSVGLRAGDIQRIVLRDPEGAILTDSAAEPLDRPKAQMLMFAAKKCAGPFWTRGTYRAAYTVRRGGEIAINYAFEMRF